MAMCKVQERVGRGDDGSRENDMSLFSMLPSSHPTDSISHSETTFVVATLFVRCPLDCQHVILSKKAFASTFPIINN